MSDSDTSFLASLSQPAVLWDAALRVCHWSPQAASLLGWTAAEVIDKPARDLPCFHAEDLPDFNLLLEQLVASRDPGTARCFRLIRKDATPVFCEWSHWRRHDPDGTPLPLLSLLREVPAPLPPILQIADEKLVYRSLFEASPGLFVVLEPHDYRIVAVSDTYLDMTMRKREELLGKVFFDAFPDDPHNPEASGTANLLASLERVKITRAKDVMAVQKHPIVNPASGELEDRYWAPINAPVLDENGRLSLLIHRTEDISAYMRNIGLPLPDVIDRGELNILSQAQELKQLNEKLQESQQRLEAIFRYASLGIAATDLDGYFIEANAAYCNMLGYSLEELQGLNVLDLTHQEERSHTLALREEIKSGQCTDFIYEKRYISKSGQQVWTRINASPLRDGKGNITNLIAISENITPVRESEETLRQIRALERIAGRIAKVGVWALEYHGAQRQVYLASETHAILEYTGDESPPIETVIQLFQPASRKAFLDALADCRDKSIPFDLECALTSFKGNHKWLRIAAEPELDSHGAVVKIIGAAQDISKQKDEQKHSQQLSSRLLATLESMSDAFYLLDKNWCFLYMNSEAENILRLVQNDVLGKNIWDCFPAFKASPGHPHFVKAMEAGEAYHAELFSEPLQNWLSISAFPSTEGFAVYFRTTTTEKLLQSRIVESEQRLKHVTEAALDIAWDIDLVQAQVWFNDGLKKFGYDNQQVLTGLDFWMSKMHPDDMPGVARKITKILTSATTEWSVHYRFRCGNGSYVHFEDRGYIIRDPGGKAVRILGGSTDITKRLEMEEQLLQSQRLESVGQLTGGIAHDFNNLLTVILGNIQLLQEQLPTNSSLRNLTDIIDIAANRGADLTRHLLAFSRKQALQPMTLDINHLLINLQGMLSHTLGENVIIRNNICKELWPALIDPGQLEVALLNLCINARDAMPDGGVVTLETRNIHLDQLFSLTHSDVAPGDYVVISITDTGMGMSPEIIDHVFEPFFTTKEKDKGTGLGLSTVFGFIKQSNGHISIYSELGSGTTLRIYLPRSHEDIEEPVPSFPSAEVIGGNEVILLVEDNELVRKFGRDQLQLLGYQVISAGGGEEGLTILKERPDIDLLFTDVVMPGLGGHELGKLARVLRPAMKILYASGYTEDSIMHNGKLDRSVHLLEKPYNRASLAAKVRAVINGAVTMEASSNGQ